MNEKQLKKFWAKIKRRGKNECWEWIASKYPMGYGRMSKNRYAHRVSWIIHFGEIPKGLCVLHKCDNPPCVNPEHLWLGTMADNIADRDRKGRYISGMLGKQHPRHGEKHSFAKLTEKDVLKIRKLHKESKLTTLKIAQLFNMSYGGISHIIYRSCWKYLT